MTGPSATDNLADPAVANAVAASNAEIAAILAEDLDAFGDFLAADVIVNRRLPPSIAGTTPWPHFRADLSATTPSTGA
jgi:hypothetical protein